jgi:hypothetical protein
MARHPRTTTLAAGAVVALAVTMTAALPASARWATHDESLATEIRTPRGATEGQTCSHRLRGRTGWAATVEAGEPPGSVRPLPAEAFTRVGYEVWRAPAGFTSFSEAQNVDNDGDGAFDDYSFFDEQGHEFPATLVRRFRTPERENLRPAEPVYEVEPGEANVYVFTAARFSPRLRAVARGDVLGVKPRHTEGTFITLTAIRCR